MVSIKKYVARTDIKMGTMARAFPSVIARLADRHATQVRTHAEHDEPLGHLDPALVQLRITVHSSRRLMGLGRRSSRALRARRGAAPTCAWCAGGRCV